MPFKLADRVKQTATTTGTGNFTLSATPTGFRAFSSVLSPSDTTYYCIAHQTANEWEVGYGTYSATNTLTRTTVISSSNSGSAVNFSAGTKDVFITQPAIGTFGTNVVIGTNINYSQNIYNNNVLVGRGAAAAGDGNVAVGDGANSNTTSGVAVGYVSLAAGAEAAAFGFQASALTAGSVAVGSTSSASSSNAVAVGKSTASSNTSTIAVGDSAQAAGTYAMAFGAFANVQGSGGIGIGNSVSIANPATGGIAIGSSAYAGAAGSVVMGYLTPSSPFGREIRIGAEQDSQITGPGTGFGNILIGYNIDTYANNPSDAIAIGDNITVIESNATYMNQFRISPSTGLVGPAYTLTYDSTTHEVYAVTSGPPPPPVVGWFTYEDYSSDFPVTINLPSDWSASYSGPSDEMILAGFVNGSPWGSPFPGSWSYQGMSGNAGYTYRSNSVNWGSLASPTDLNASGPADGFSACWIFGVQADGASGYFNVLGFSGNTTFTVAPYYSGFPLVGSSPRYGRTVAFIVGGDFTSTAVIPAGGTLVGSVYDMWFNTTILFIEYDNTAVGNIQSGSIPLYTLPSSYSTTNFFWYNYT